MLMIDSGVEDVLFDNKRKAETTITIPTKIGIQSSYS